MCSDYIAPKGSYKLYKSVTGIWVECLKEQVETKVSMCSSLLFEDEYQDGELHEGEIEKCIWKLRNNKTGESLFGTKKPYQSAA